MSGCLDIHSVQTISAACRQVSDAVRIGMSQPCTCGMGVTSRVRCLSPGCYCCYCYYCSEVGRAAHLQAPELGIDDSRRPEPPASRAHFLSATKGRMVRSLAIPRPTPSPAGRHATWPLRRRPWHVKRCATRRELELFGSPPLLIPCPPSFLTPSPGLPPPPTLLPPLLPFNPRSSGQQLLHPALSRALLLATLQLH